MQSVKPVKNRKPIKINLGWQAFFVRVLLVTTGTLIGVISVIVFFAPSNIAPTGVTGLSVILNYLFSTPIGIVTLFFNIPILYLAYRMLDGLRSVLWTGYVVVVYALAIDILVPFFPAQGVSDNELLNAIFAGILSGIGGGFILRGGGTFGGTATLARILQMRFGMPLSSTYLYTNIIIVLLAGIFLGWESALYSLVALVLEGSASDYTLEGPSVIRTVTIITNKPTDVANVILYQLQRGVTSWKATGMYTGEERMILFVTVARPQVSLLRTVVFEVDPTAFVIVGQGHVAYGSGFVRQVPVRRTQSDTAQPVVEETELMPFPMGTVSADTGEV
ncbi:MAG: YitT family protein [Chloroflexota bacterium]